MRIFVLAVLMFVVDLGAIVVFFPEKIAPDFQPDAWMVLVFLACIVLSILCVTVVFDDGR